MKEAAYMIRNHANANAERLAISEQLTFWRHKLDSTSDTRRIAAYKRIIADLTEIAERMGARDAS